MLDVAFHREYSSDIANEKYYFITSVSVYHPNILEVEDHFKIERVPETLLNKVYT
jgi:hypothetical protein